MKKLNLRWFLGISKRDIFVSLLAINFASIFVLFFTYLIFARDLQSKEGIMNRNDTGLTLLDRNNQPFFTFYQAKYKNFVPLSEISPSIQQAVIASEDKDFYHHPGFSIKSIARSVVLDLKSKDLAFGGSTLTQQLVKNSLLSSQKSFLRKYQEVVLAAEIERRYSKQEILEMYLNSVYFGEGAFGVDEAAETYFGKHAKDLNLAESSLLVAILPSPSALSPLSGDQARTQKLQTIVIDKMLQQHYIDQSQKTQALATKVELHPENSLINIKAPHFAIFVKDQLVKEYGEETIARSGFKVKTTIDLDWQDFAQEAVAKQVEVLKSQRVADGAAVVIDPQTGEIKVMVGSKDWYDETFGKINMAVTPRQPGSSFKPIVYLAALEKHLITPATVLKDEPVTYHIPGSPDYKPQNYDLKFRGPVLARRALANSLNVPAVEVMSKVGVPGALEMAQRLGISSLNQPERYGLSLVLGAGEVSLVELTGVYGTFANQGVKVKPTAILEIKDKRSKTIHGYKPEAKKVVDPVYPFQIASILSDRQVRQEVFGNLLDTNVGAAVKTGTTNDYKDSWTMGFTPNLAVGVWIGNPDNTTMEQVAGSVGAAPIFRQLVDKFSDSPAKFIPPAEALSLVVCKYNGGVLKEASPSAGYTEYFAPGTEPTQPCFIPKPSSSPTASANPSMAPGTSAAPAPSPTTSAPEANPAKKDEKKKTQLNQLLTLI